jgi:hypothetical protein
MSLTQYLCGGFCQGSVVANRGVNRLSKNDPSRVLYFLMNSKPLPGTRLRVKSPVIYKASLSPAGRAAALARRGTHRSINAKIKMRSYISALTKRLIWTKGRLSRCRFANSKSFRILSMFTNSKCSRNLSQLSRR